MDTLASGDWAQTAKQKQPPRAAVHSLLAPPLAAIHSLFLAPPRAAVHM